MQTSAKNSDVMRVYRHYLLRTTKRNAAVKCKKAAIPWWYYLTDDATTAHCDCHQRYAKVL